MQDLRLRLDITSFLEMVKLGEIEVQWVDKTHQSADPLTKYGWGLRGPPRTSFSPVTSANVNRRNYPPKLTGFWF